mmetsp:Transcript_16182/g.44805  ORF Transcript_16182/g.44805 Transcript_16182/m.44805 type:complete len:151 (-) Transcript_16182:516-968(-)
MFWIKISEFCFGFPSRNHVCPILRDAMNTGYEDMTNKIPNKLKYHGPSTSGSMIAMKQINDKHPAMAINTLFFCPGYRFSVAARNGNAKVGPINIANREQQVFQKFAYKRNPPLEGSRKKLRPHNPNPINIILLKVSDFDSSSHTSSGDP